jgi:hypothetical protein
MSKLDVSRFMVLGEGLAAGMVNFSLYDDDQSESFPAQLARQLKTEFPQALFQPPGIGDAPGFPQLPVRLPFDQQTTVLKNFPPSGEVSNLSLPCLKLSDVVSRRPCQPVVQGADALQTALNLVIGLPSMLRGEITGLPTLLEYAVACRPTFAIIELGFAEALEASASADPSIIPAPSEFKANYQRIMKSLREQGCEIVVMTIPDPMDTAHFSTLEAASRAVRLTPGGIAAKHGLKSDDRISVNGLSEIGYQVITRKTTPLPTGSILSGKTAAEISGKIKALNQEIALLARENGAILHDLGGLFSKVRQQGLQLGTKKLTSDFLGGFYSLNGYYPGKTGQAAIANDLIRLINRTWGTAYESVDAAEVMAGDPVADYQLPQGPSHDTFEGTMAAAGLKLRVLRDMGQFILRMIKGNFTRKPTPEPPSSGNDPSKWKIKLPAGMVQELPLHSDACFYGDALRPVHTRDEGEAFFGITGKLLFGGLALLDSRLSGSVKIKFFPPVNNVSHFEVTHPGGLKGEDGRLSSPQFFILPGIQNQVMDPTEVRSKGDLNLITGEVTSLDFKFFFLNSAIMSLANVNPVLPKDPINFPGVYGSTWAKFEPRPDGKLDYTFFGTTFIPLSVLKAPIRFPLTFMGADGNYAHIPSDGTALHPHIHLSTKAPEAADPGVELPEIPFNSIREFTASIHNNSFGDDFSLNADELGGPAAGRSHLVGRFQVQFGERFGDAVTMSISALPSGGLFTTLPQSPIAAAFQRRIPDSLVGHDEPLLFPKQVYNMDIISYLDDPLDIAVCAVNLKTGKVIDHMLRRGMITTSWLWAMIQLEERIPKNTFCFRGPASFEKGVNGQMVFRYRGDLHIPFPAGFKFPAPDLKNTFIIGPDSALDPYVRWQAMSVPGCPRIAVSGGASRVKASTGQEFSYSYSIPKDGGKAEFEYTNHTQGSTFRLNSLTYVGFLNSRTSKKKAGEFDTVTFTGFGSWSADPSRGIHIATVQVSTSELYPYISILIDGGPPSNVNTRPEDVAVTMP